ncbi:MAG: alpha/beta hydrolase [Zoogloeaceae bacterium]|nr:alpha/beta hydrolase [Zoogloeaceae bacterium]
MTTPRGKAAKKPLPKSGPASAKAAPPPSPAPSATPASGYSDAARIAVQETTARVQEMHQAIAAKSFDVLTRIPVISGPASLAQLVHNAISKGVYAAIHHGTEGVLGAAAVIERNLPASEGNAASNRTVSSVRSALNAAFGDHLAGLGNVLAIDMGIYCDGRPIAIDSAALDATFPDSRRKLCVFIHGLAFDEHCWQPAGKNGEVDFGQALLQDFGYTPLYLRYNSGLPIADNGARLALLLEALLAAWPEQVEELLLIGHSMGGLIARNACEQAASSELYWPQATGMLVCLGSPHSGSPVARLGHAATAALNMTRITAPLGKIADARSQGIKDLRHGPGSNPQAPHDIAFRFVGSTLTEDMDHPLAEWFGDGLVTLGSATEHPVVGDVKSIRFGGIAHMALLTDQRVYAQISAWLQETANG